MMLFSESLQKKLFLLLLVVLIFVVYGQAVNYEFVGYDDSQYIPLSAKKISAASIYWAFTSLDAANWHPLTWLSLILDYNLYGAHAGGYHLTNIMLHALNSLLLFFLLHKMTGTFYRSFFVAALFALHPLHVESVAWVAERKDVLSTFFWFTTIWAYYIYSKAPDWRKYLLVIFSFMLGLMAKPMLVTLPFALLLLDYWPLGRMISAQQLSSNAAMAKKSFASLIGEKVPLFILTLFSCIITYIAQTGYHAVVSLENISLARRILNAFNSYGAYLAKTFSLRNLGVFYPYPDKFDIPETAAAIITVIALSALAVILIKKIPYLLTGWFWFLGTLVPVIGIVQVGAQAMADRYTYVPLVGVFIVLAWGLRDLLSKIQYGKYLGMIAAIIFFAAAVPAAYYRVQIWENNFTLFGHAVEFDKKKYIAYHIIGYNAAKYGENEKALYYYYLTLQFNPRYDPAYLNAGNVLQKMGKLDEALNCYQKAWEINNRSSDALYNMGIILVLQNKPAEAVGRFREALKIKPDDADVHNNLGIALIRSGEISGGLHHFQRALELNPDSAEFQKNVSAALQIQRDAGRNKR